MAQDCNGHADVNAESTQRCARPSGIEGGYQAIYPTNRANYSNGNNGFTRVNMDLFIMIYCYIGNFGVTIGQLQQTRPNSDNVYEIMVCPILGIKMALGLPNMKKIRPEAY